MGFLTPDMAPPVGMLPGQFDPRMMPGRRRMSMGGDPRGRPQRRNSIAGIPQGGFGMGGAPRGFGGMGIPGGMQQGGFGLPQGGGMGGQPPPFNFGGLPRQPQPMGGNPGFGQPNMGGDPRLFQPPRQVPPLANGGMGNLFGLGGGGNQPGAVFDPTRAAEGARSPRRQAKFTRALHEARAAGQVLGKNGLLQNYKRIRPLNKGGMAGALYVVRGRQDGRHHVEKQIKMEGPFAKRARAELATLKVCRGHTNLNQLIESKMLGSNHLVVIIEYCDRGSLDERIQDARKQGGPQFNEAGLWNILQGVCDGLAFLHNGVKTIGGQPDPQWDTIAHLDLKPPNIFLSSFGGECGELRVVLADFGCAVPLSDIHNRKEPHAMQEFGTPGWYPPEGLPWHGGPTGYGTKTDMYMLGATVQACSQLETLIDKRGLASPMPCGQFYSQELNQMIKLLTQLDYKARPAARKVAPVALEQLRRYAGKQQNNFVPGKRSKLKRFLGF